MSSLPTPDLDTRIPRIKGTRRSQLKGDRRPSAHRWPLGLVLPVVLTLLWELLARVGILAPNLMPAPTVVLATIVDLAVRGELWQHIGITLYRVLLGFLIGGSAATVLGALTGYFPKVRRILDPTLQALRNIPSIAWVPLFILWLGIYEPSKIALIAVGVFFPIYLNLMTGIQQVDRKLVEVGRVYRLSQWQLIWRVFLPATLPSYLVGLRGGLGLGWMFVVAAELMGASRGLGFLLVDGQTTGRPAIIIASIILFAILGKLTDSALAVLTHHLLSWQDTHGSEKSS
ncbi:MULTISPECIES: ABC transporter permease [unclassified Leptolyngbya]|uniref:ABC transporter permease n=1 Tax=unclassified Leptolyngbya TaxID=2650499 RepID=UPI00168756CA|nr:MULTISPECIES: ABC transporter permease [unclassified Leptolyngbya]MBD1909921.1 ABC transporter permease [Leptolyngbya sp. FACHB-8]MBD2158615.1 ABC transporter permease [Leptolyngbya sp. FACHB-16]